MLKRAFNVIGSILLLTIPLHVFMSSTGTCTQSDTGHFGAAMLYTGVTAVLVGICLIGKPRYNRIQLGFIALAALATPQILSAFFSTTIAGHSLCGADFDDYGVERWERFFAPFFIVVLAGFTGLIWIFRKQQRKQNGA